MPLGTRELFQLYPNHPAPGCCEKANGALVSGGFNGGSYSSSVNSYNGVYLGFVTASLNPSVASYRAYGLPLRCLSE